MLHCYLVNVFGGVYYSILFTFFSIVAVFFWFFFCCRNNTALSWMKFCVKMRLDSPQNAVEYQGHRSKVTWFFVRFVVSMTPAEST